MRRFRIEGFDKEDQGTSDADQTASDEDQTAADADQGASEADETAAGGDQRASDRDQAAADLDFESDGSTPNLVELHDLTRAQRAQGTAERGAAHLLRSQTSSRRLQTADIRDRQAAQRDAAADQRDRVAEAFDRRAAQLAAADPDSNGLPEALRAAVAVRNRAAEDRARAARDRQRAAEDRERAAADREAADMELGRAHVDHLTGAYSRGVGEAALVNEMIRAKRTGTELVMAFIDVDGLKDINDTRGHQAGDTLLHEVANAVRLRLRPYDPLVRLGGDEFVCAVSGADAGSVRARFNEIQASLKHGSISVGLAEMGPDDELADLIERSDESLRHRKRRARLG